MGVRFDQQDVKRISQKLSIEGMSGPLRRLLERIGLTVERAGRQRAPVEHGTLRRDISTEVDPATPPQFAKIGTDITNRGVSYPAVLDAGDDKLGRVFHYQTHPLFQTQQTEGWFTEHAFNDAKPKFPEILRQAGDEIKDDWERRS